MTNAPGYLMAEEIAAIPDVVARQLHDHCDAYLALGHEWRADPPLFFATCGRGTSDQAALFFKYLTEIGTGIPVASLGPSLGSLYATGLKMQGAAMLAISQSGASPDLVALAQKAGTGGARTVALLNTIPSPLANVCFTTLPLAAGPERAVAATKSFVASLVAIAAIHAGQTGDASLLASLHALPDTLRSCQARAGKSLQPLTRTKRLFCLGRGLGLAIAGEAALKLKETCLLAAESVSSAEFRHGPLALAGPDTAALVILADDETRRGTEDLVAVLKDRGAAVLTLGTGDADFSVPATGHAATDMIAAITLFYDLVQRLSVSLGLDPDAPPHLVKATLTQ